MMDQREGQDHAAVAITGIGLICCLGADTATCWRRLVEGRSGIDVIRRFDASGCATRIAGELPREYYEAEREAFPKKVFRQSTLSSRATLMAAREAVGDAAVDLRDLDVEKVAVITGCGGSTYGDELVFANEGDRPRRRKVPIVSHGMLNALSACVTIEFGFKGPSFNVATACASGAYAVGAGFEYVRRTGGACLAIGVDTLVYEDTVRGFNALMALSERNEDPQRASRPFDKLRDGFVLSEGACALFLEPYERAVARGVVPYALITGYGANSEAYNIVAPDMSGAGMAEAMERALACAGIPKERVGYISAHGTSTYHNDVAETRAIKKVFGDLAPRIAVSSQKSMIGHSIGAAGAIEVAVCALTLKHQILTPTINYEVPDPDCDLDYVPNTARRVSGLEAAMSNSFGFGGHNCSIVLERCPQENDTGAKETRVRAPRGRAMRLPETQWVLLDLQEGILTVTVADPPHNHLSTRVLKDLALCVPLMESDAVRAVVVKGKGRNFSKGADPEELGRMEPHEHAGVLQFCNDVLWKLSRLRKPVVAAIDGACFGGGLELALACHLRVASDRAILGLPELNLGLIPGLGGIQRLTRVIGETKALEMVLLGDLIPAAKAAELHLVNRVFPRKDFEERSRLWVKTILSVPQQSIQEALTLFTSARSPREKTLVDDAAQAFLRLLPRGSAGPGSS